MATENDTQNPFTRPGFITAAIVIALVVVLGITIAIVNATRQDEPDPTPTSDTATSSTPSATPTPEPTTPTSDASICGLDGQEGSDAPRLTTAPSVDEWAYQGTIGYPVSSDYGPGATTPAGVRYCFQHSQTGALFMAANAVAQGSDGSMSAQWAEQALAAGPYRDALLAQIGGGSSSEGTRLSVAGFRILHYDGATARVDLGTKVSSEGQNVTMSAVYELVWQDGDWKVSSDVAMPLDAASIPDLGGYITWGE